MEQSLIGNMLAYLDTWGYHALFLFAFLETAGFLGLFFPGETIVVIGGLLASQGTLELDKAIAAAGAGAVAGDTTAYLLARYFGARLLARPRWFLNRENLEATERFFAEHGGKTLVLGRFTAWLRALTPLAAGLAKMPAAKFLFFSAYGGIAWALVFSVLGYLAGTSWGRIKGVLGELGAFAFILAALIAYVVFLLQRRRRELRRTARWLDRTLTRRTPVTWAFLKDRFSLGVWYGLNLTVSLVLLAGALLAFNRIVEARISEETLRGLDQHIERIVGALVTPPVAEVIAGIANTGAIYMMFGTIAALIAWFGLRRDRGQLFTLSLTVGVGELFFLALKLYFSRIQPLPDSIAADFPSGPAFSAMLVYGYLMVVAWQYSRSEIASVLIFTLAPVIIVLIGFSQIYVHSHWFSDVLAGYTAALAWLAVSVSISGVVRGQGMGSRV